EGRGVAFRNGELTDIGPTKTIVMNRKLQTGLITFLAVVLIVFYFFQSEKNEIDYDELTDDEKHLPEHAVFGLDALHGLDVQLMASEPLLINPTNIDVDDKGRVWVLPDPRRAGYGNSRYSSC